MMTAAEWFKNHGGEIGDRIRFNAPSPIGFVGLSTEVTGVGTISVQFIDLPYLWAYSGDDPNCEIVKAKKGGTR